MYENQELMTRKQVAEYLSCSVDTVDRMVADGTLTRRYLRPAVSATAPDWMYGSLPRFRKSDVEAVVEKAFGKRNAK